MAGRRSNHARANMREVAQTAGVAMSSVSRVLSDHPDVSPAMRERVMAAVERLGYQPDLLAQSMRRQLTKTVGFLVGDIANPLLAQIASGAESALRAAGYSMLLTDSENDPRLDAAHVSLLAQRRVDGMLLSPASEDHRATLAALERLDSPIVLIDRELPADLEASAVLSDHRTGMRAAVEHLLDLGHRDIGLILGPRLRFTRERRLGLEEAYELRGLPPSHRTAQGWSGGPQGREAARELLTGEHPPTAIIAGGNQLLDGLLEELRERGLGVGSDMSVVSCDAVSLTELYDPPIAVVRRDNVELGRRAAELLLAELQEGDHAPQQIVLPTEFVARPSCAPPAR